MTTLKDDLNSAHETLLGVHKALIDHERVRYEREHGSIGGPNAVFKLVVGDPWFAWLRPLTSLIVEIDEFVSSRKPGAPEEGAALLERVRALLSPAEEGGDFRRGYSRALRESPEVARAHAEWKLALMRMGKNDGEPV